MQMIFGVVSEQISTFARLLKITVAVWELYIFRIMDGNVDNVSLIPLGDKHKHLKNLKNFKDDATCSSKRKAGEEEQNKIRKIMGRDAKR